MIVSEGGGVGKEERCANFFISFWEQTRRATVLKIFLGGYARRGERGASIICCMCARQEISHFFYNYFI